MTTAPTDKQVGWIGIGSQGGPMARVLAKSGVPTKLWARRPEALEEYKDTPATYADTALDLLTQSDVVIVVVRADDDLKELFGAGEGSPVSQMKAGATIIVHSTVHPDTVIALGGEAAKYGVKVVDAPVSGGGHAAEDKSLLVMTAGDPADVAAIKPILEQYSNTIPYLGPLGAGQRAKLINNFMLTANMGVAQSAFALAKELHVDPENLKLVITNGSGRSFGVNMVGGEDWDLKPAAAVAGPLLQKDARLLVDLAEAAGVKTGVSLDAADSALANMGLTR